MNYNRIYNLSVIEQIVENLAETTSFPLSSSEGYNFPYAETSNGSGVLVDDLQITASIKSLATTSDNSNTEITIYNASEATRAKLEIQNAYIILEAGYEESVGIIFTGNILSYSTVKDGTNVVTTLVCATSEVPIKTSRSSISYAPNYQNGNYGDVIRDIVAQMKLGGVAEGVIVTDQSNLRNLPNPDNTSLKGGYSFRGHTTQLLDKICEQFDYVWYITLGELYIHPKFYNSFGVKYSIVNSQIKSIRPEQDTTNISPTITRPSGLKCIVSLDHRMKTGETVEVLEGEYKGLYKILSVEHDLNFEGDTWDTILALEVV
jgi:hypothetical protein